MKCNLVRIGKDDFQLTLCRFLRKCDLKRQDRNLILIHRKASLCTHEIIFPVHVEVCLPASLKAHRNAMFLRSLLKNQSEETVFPGKCQIGYAVGVIIMDDLHDQRKESDTTPVHVVGNTVYSMEKIPDPLRRRHPFCCMMTVPAAACDHAVRQCFTSK